MKRLPAVIALTALALCSAPASASSFPRDPGTVFVDLDYTSYESGTFIDNAGGQHPNGCTFRKNETSLYLEAGLTRRDTVTAQLPYDALRCGNATTSGFTDLEVGFDHNLHRGATTTFGVRADLIVPTGYSIAVNPRLGYGRTGTEESVLYGGSIGRYGYFDTQTGVRFFSGYPATQFHTTGTLGFHPGPVLVYGQLDYVTHIGAGATLTNIGVNPTVQASYTAIQGTLASSISVAPHTALFLGSTSLLGGRNTGLGHSVTIGLWGTF